MNKEIGMLLAKKELIQVEKGKVIIITTPIHSNHTHRFHPLATPYSC